MLADNRVFDLGVDDLSALDAFVLELKDDLDIPGYEEDLLRAMVMEADEAADTLSEYGTIDEERIEEIRDARERTEAREEAAARNAEEYVPPAAGTQPQEEGPARRSSSARNAVSGYGCEACCVQRGHRDRRPPAHQKCVLQRRPGLYVVLGRKGQPVPG